MRSALPLVAIVGRPNVGKSTLFNRLVGRRAAIVEDLPGVTRDRHYGEAELLGERFFVVDTGGFEPAAEDGMLKAMRRQAEVAVEEADVVIALFDGREGLLPADREIVRLLERSGKPVHYGVNKIDGPRHDPLVAEFWELGVAMLWPLSAQHGGGYLDLMEAALADLPPAAEESDDEGPLGPTRVAIIGKPNVGKSTLVNRLLGEERLLTADAPGTTRDAIDAWLALPPDPGAVERARAALEAFDGAVAPAPSTHDLPADPPRGADQGAHGARQGEGGEVGSAARGAQGEDDAGGLDGLGGAGGEGDAVDFEAPLGEGLGELLAPASERDFDVDEASEALAAERERARDRLEEAVARAEAPRRYLLIDTAGVRRRKWVEGPLERYSIVKSFKSIDRADVCLLLVDATQGVVSQDAKLAGLIRAKGKACVLLVNKWDAVADKDTYTAGRFVRQLREDLAFISYAPIVFISGLTGQRTHRILPAVDRAREAWLTRISTAALNRFLADTVARKPPPVHRNKRPRFFYATQVSAGPPTFLIMTSEPKAVHFSYRRFLANRIRERWGFEGTPIRLVFRKKKTRRGR